MQALVEYDWPGNIRELENAIHRAIVLMDGDEITYENIFPKKNARSETSLQERDLENLSFEEFQKIQKKAECDFIVAKIRKNGGSIKKTAEEFGMMRQALYAHAARIGLDIKSIRKEPR